MASIGTTQLGIRVPAELAAWLKQQATANKRSVSNQVAWVLDQYYKTQTQTQGVQQ